VKDLSVKPSYACLAAPPSDAVVGHVSLANGPQSVVKVLGRPGEYGPEEEAAAVSIAGASAQANLQNRERSVEFLTEVVRILESDGEPEEGIARPGAIPGEVLLVELERRALKALGITFEDKAS
jgi:hypothetical protein